MLFFDMFYSYYQAKEMQALFVLALEVSPFRPVLVLISMPSVP